jgi:hypothetical protein
MRRALPRLGRGARDETIIHALQSAQQIEMQRVRLDGRGLRFGQMAEMRGRRLGLDVAEVRFLIGQSPGGAVISGHEGGCRQAQIGAETIEHRAHVGTTAAGEHESALELAPERRHCAAIDRIAGKLQVGRKGENGGEPFIVILRQCLGIERDQIVVDRAVQAIEDVVHAARLDDFLPIVLPDRIGNATQHFVEHVDHAQSFARGVAKRDRRGLGGGRIEIERPRRILRLDPRRQACAQQPRERPQQRQEDECGCDIEHQMKVRHPARQVGLEAHKLRADPIEQGQEDRGADQPVEEIAECDTQAGAIAAARHLQHGIERRADIGAKHERQRRIERNHPPRRK